jgi:hypothetical protein
MIPPAVTATLHPYTLPGVRPGPDNPLPFFRPANPHTTLSMLDSIPPAKRETFGKNIAFRLMPYRYQDEYSRQKASTMFQSVVLENEHLKATFLPEVGGRLVSLFDKPHQRELLSCNPVFQPANLAIRNAWFSGGIEWNIGHVGHSVFTCAPLFAGWLRAPDGTPGVRFYEYERMHGLFWHIDFWLPPHSPFLFAYTRVVNPHASERPMYWWTNIAVPETPDLRVLAPAQEVIYLGFGEKGAQFGMGEMPCLPSIAGPKQPDGPPPRSFPGCPGQPDDASYPVNFSFASEYFFQCDGVPRPWEAALDGRGTGFIDCSTARMAYRKMFCWGMHPGGRHWQQFLADADTRYVEIQGGLAPTQGHGLTLPAATLWDWTQAFGYFEADPQAVHSPNWAVARSEVECQLNRRLSTEQLQSFEMQFRLWSEQRVQSHVMLGSGWGALERKRFQQEPPGLDLPAAFEFPDAALGREQEPWLALLKTGRFPQGCEPGEWMVQAEWLCRLEAGLRDEEHESWLAYLHLGNMKLEQLDEDGAERAWEKSISLQPSAWAYRNLSILAKRRNQPDDRLRYYRQAWALHRDHPTRAIAEEWVELLLEFKLGDEARSVMQGLPETIRSHDRLRIAAARLALVDGQLDEVERLINYDFAVIREGETALTDLWRKVKTRKLAAERGVPYSNDLIPEAMKKYPPPSRIDFRLVNDK